MTDQEILTAVDTYMLHHLDSEYWDELDDDKKSQSVNMAINDILAELPRLTIAKLQATSYGFKAIAEQAVFLARNYENINENKVVTGENAGGVSASYTLVGTHPGISIRAQSFIKGAKSAFITPTLRFKRG